MLRFKPEVRISYLDDRLATLFAGACLWSLRARVDVEVNSVEDGASVHMTGSLHAYSLAVDFDTVGDKRADTLALAEWFRRQLPPQFDVIFEGDHVHVEWDARRPALRAVVTT